MNTSTVQANEAAIARPKYYEMDVALRANATERSSRAPNTGETKRS